MSAQASKEARRDLRRAIGEEALGLLESNSEELRRIDHQNRAAIGRAMMILGRDTDADIKNPVLKRLDILERKHQELLDAYNHHLDQQDRFNRASFWVKVRWLLTGRKL